jgi:GntR family transcriptional regulator
MQNTLPKYLLISQQIITSIKNGDLVPGMQIPSENDIRRRFGVSNTTARKVLHEIELRGLATRVKGRGTFVRNMTTDHSVERALGSINMTRSGFDENMLREGFVPSIRVLEKAVLQNGFFVNIAGHEYRIKGPVFKLHRLRIADNLVMKDEIRYVSMSICKKVDKTKIEDYASLFEMYEKKYHLQITKVRQNLTTRIMSETETSHFELDEPVSVFELNGATFCAKDMIVEIETSIYRGDKYRFSVESNSASRK